VGVIELLLVQNGLKQHVDGRHGPRGVLLEEEDEILERLPGRMHRPVVGLIGAPGEQGEEDGGEPGRSEPDQAVRRPDRACPAETEPAGLALRRNGLDRRNHGHSLEPSPRDSFAKEQ
jgi:hypothetical protein